MKAKADVYVVRFCPLPSLSGWKAPISNLEFCPHLYVESGTGTWTFAAERPLAYGWWMNQLRSVLSLATRTVLNKKNEHEVSPWISTRISQLVFCLPVVCSLIFVVCLGMCLHKLSELLSRCSQGVEVLLWLADRDPSVWFLNWKMWDWANIRIRLRRTLYWLYWSFFVVKCWSAACSISTRSHRFVSILISTLSQHKTQTVRFNIHLFLSSYPKIGWGLIDLAFLFPLILLECRPQFDDVFFVVRNNWLSL